MLYAGLDLSRKRLDFHLLDAEGATVEVGAAPPDADGLRVWVPRTASAPPRTKGVPELPRDAARWNSHRLSRRGVRLQVQDR
jgi:hypothetical protein